MNPLRVIAILAGAPLALCAQMPAMHEHHMANADVPTIAVSGLNIPDVVLLNQHGEKVRFFSDLIKGKVVAINTIYTTCTTICPIMGANFARLRRVMQDRAEGKVNLISISIDPVVDTPERLNQWSRTFGETGPGWTLLTGPKSDVDRLLKALRVFTSDKADHAPVALIGSESGADWARASALLAPTRLAELIQARTAPH